MEWVPSHLVFLLSYAKIFIWLTFAYYWIHLLFKRNSALICKNHGLQTPINYKAFFQWNAKLLGLGRHIGRINVGVFFGRTISTYPFATVKSLSIFFIIQPLFLQKTKPLYPHPKYLIGIWIWAGFSFHVSVVSDSDQGSWKTPNNSATRKVPSL